MPRNSCTGPGTPMVAADFEEQLVACQEQIRRYILSLVRDQHEAEELLQRTNLVLWRKRGGFEAGTSFTSWSFSVAKFEVFNRLRQLRRDRRIFLHQLREAPAPEEATDTEAGESLAALRECVKRLPLRDQELISMRYGSDCTLADYARRLRRSPGTLKARLFKIREILRIGIEDHLRRAEAGGMTPAARL